MADYHSILAKAVDALDPKRWLESKEIAAKAVTLRERERRDAERFHRPPIHRGAGFAYNG
jgi:hypothetical protein